MSNESRRTAFIVETILAVEWCRSRRAVFGPKQLREGLAEEGFPLGRRSIHRWLVALESAGVIERDGHGVYRALR